MQWVARLGLSMRDLAVRRTPDPFVLALALTALAFVSAWLSHPSFDLQACVLAWSDASGIWKLLRFSMQAALMLLLGSVLADAPIFHRALANVAKRLPSARAMVATTALCSVSLALLNWSLSIVGGALFARECGQQAKARGWDLHYPLLCAAGYSGMMVWHGGLSGTAPLKITRQEDLHEILGASSPLASQVVPLQETLFSPLNLAVNAGLVLLALVGFYALTPKSGSDPKPQLAPDLQPSALEPERNEARPLQGLFALSLGLLLAIAFGVQLAQRGIGALDLNLLNLALWSLSLLAHRRLDQWLASVEKNISGCAGILVQFPLYAGIMGLLLSMGLSQTLAGWMEQLPEALMLLFTLGSAALLNVFVPSGGGQWAIQGPVLFELAANTGQAPGPLVMAMAYGDQLTNMIQPFWALPLLGITKVRARDISGYCLLWMLVGGLWIIAMLWVFTS